MLTSQITFYNLVAMYSLKMILCDKENYNLPVGLTYDIRSL